MTRRAIVLAFWCLFVVVLAPVAAAAPPPAFGFSPGLGSPLSVGEGSHGLAFADFDGNGTLDIATTGDRQGSSNFSVLLVGRNGRTHPAPESPVAVAPLAVGDFNEDGRADLLTGYKENSSPTPPSPLLSLGDGRGGFNPASEPLPPSVEWPGQVVVSDVNGDRHLDVLIASDLGAGIAVLLGNGRGGFAQAPGSPLPVGSVAQFAVGDMTNDGHTDIVSLGYWTDEVAVHVGDGTGRFSKIVEPDVLSGTQPHEVALGDFDDDGRLDAAVTTNNWSGCRKACLNVNILRGDGAGGLTPMPHSPAWEPKTKVGGLRVADFNGDGHDDLLMTYFPESPPYSGPRLYLGDGRGRLHRTPAFLPAPLRSNELAGLAVTDLNGDSRPDLVTTRGNPGSQSRADYVWVLLNHAKPAVRPTLTVTRRCAGRVRATIIGDQIRSVTFSIPGRRHIVTLRAANGANGAWTTTVLAARRATRVTAVVRFVTRDSAIALGRAARRCG
jgi:hypothetical protein